MGAGFLHAFLDESYGADRYYMAAVVVDDPEYRKSYDGLDRVASTAHEQFNVDPDVEFHAHDIMQGRKSWECFRGQVHEAVALYRAAARAVRESGALLTIEGFMNLNRRVRGVQIELLGQFFANSVRSKIGSGCPKQARGPLGPRQSTPRPAVRRASSLVRPFILM